MNSLSITLDLASLSFREARHRAHHPKTRWKAVSCHARFSDRGAISYHVRVFYRKKVLAVFGYMNILRLVAIFICVRKVGLAKFVFVYKDQHGD